MRIGWFPLAFLSYDDLRRHGARFLDQHHPSRTIPVPIEEIAESQLRMDIVPVPGLQDALPDDEGGVVGFLTTISLASVPA